MAPGLHLLCKLKTRPGLLLFLGSSCSVLLACGCCHAGSGGLLLLYLALLALLGLLGLVRLIQGVLRKLCWKVLADPKGKGSEGTSFLQGHSRVRRTPTNARIP